MMTDFYGQTWANTPRAGGSSTGKADGALSRSKLRHTRNIFITGATPPAAGDRLYLGRLPVGGAFHSIRVTASASLGAATLAAGSASAPAKYRAAATQTTPDTPVVTAPTAALAQPLLTAEEDVWVTIGAAGLPANQTIVIELAWNEAA